MQLDELKAQLREGTVSVTFKKVNGDVRVMKCTLNKSVIPETATPKGKITPVEDSKSVRVYDIEAGGWRSFLFDNLIKVET